MKVEVVGKFLKDFSKAFDNVCHCLLLQKFEASPNGTCALRFAPFLPVWQDSAQPNWQLCFERNLGDVWCTSRQSFGSAVESSYGSLMISPEFSVALGFFMPMT
jgi:hypothetical protein